MVAILLVVALPLELFYVLVFVVVVRSSFFPTTVGCCIPTTTHFLPNIQAFAFALASLYSGVVLPTFKLLERGTWASTSITIYLCNLSLISLTFAKDQMLLKIVFSCLSTYLWILMIFAFDVIIALCVVMASFSCLLISLSLFATSFCITFLCRMAKYWYDVTT